MKYVEVTREEVEALRAGLQLLERVLDNSDSDVLQLYLYGVSKDISIVDAAKEAIADDMNSDGDTLDSDTYSESDVNIGEVAVGIRISSDNLYYLTGSGLILREESFVYDSGNVEGVRETTLRYAHSEPRVTLSAFTSLAIANSDSWLDSFYKQYGSKTEAMKPTEVGRTEEATAEKPLETATEPKEEPSIPKQTSLHIASAIEDFLG
jgi:hypothetical protein